MGAAAGQAPGSRSRRRGGVESASTRSVGALTRCPACATSMPAKMVDDHLGSQVCESQRKWRAQQHSRTQAAAWTALCVDNGRTLHLNASIADQQDEQARADAAARIAMGAALGVSVVDEFVTEHEEATILEYVRSSDLRESSFNGRHMGCKWGVDCDLYTRKTYEATRELPEVLQNIMARFKSVAALATPARTDWTPNEANAIWYDARHGGHFLGAHVDDRFMSKGPIVNLSLGGDCVMTYEREREQDATTGRLQLKSIPPELPAALQTVRVHLRRRSLQVMDKVVRYRFTHEIRAEDFLSDARCSITFRHSPVTEHGEMRPRGPTLY
ncbi:hypothetical protein FVE85_1079 [Porphyridium purpureum]|uniref:Fe2OG dioxygenase domain-containing protein n=1 Tax=Porphyridium purpureum TaxID=35688 RepID=A0A5J4Z245_PORPP|nr:hypothetical protein FVE85_1079 [Porphyridium purpureum]|eukprot:POR8166..scf208_2